MRAPLFLWPFGPVQEAIEEAEKGDFSGVRRVLRSLESPFESDGGGEGGGGGKDYPDWAADLVCTCSS